jgi:His-Xaa-Ser system protein HxsD
MRKNVKKNNNIIFELDTKVYPLEAIIGASYMFIDRAYIFLDSHRVNKIEVNFKAKAKMAGKQLEIIKDEFFNELLHNTARIMTAKRNKKVREFIVGRALFSAVENAGEEETINDTEDPLGIATPWREEKGLNKKTKSKKKKLSKKT